MVQKFWMLRGMKREGNTNKVVHEFRFGHEPMDIEIETLMNDMKDVDYVNVIQNYQLIQPRNTGYQE